MHRQVTHHKPINHSLAANILCRKTRAACIYLNEIFFSSNCMCAPVVKGPLGQVAERRKFHDHYIKTDSTARDNKYDQQRKLMTNLKK